MRFFCKFQLLNIGMLNVIIPQFWIHYLKAISALLNRDPLNWMLYSEIVFPRAAKCTYEAYGPSGSLQKFDALCLLPLNILNQKLFIIVWTWYIVQLIISISNLLYWILVSHSEYVRVYILYRKAMESVSRKIILNASRKARLGHFFVLNQIAKNANPMSFVELLSDLALNAKKHNQNVNELTENHT